LFASKQNSQDWLLKSNAKCIQVIETNLSSLLVFVDEKQRKRYLSAPKPNETPESQIKVFTFKKEL
jgi:hypothetical protein